MLRRSLRFLLLGVAIAAVFSPRVIAQELPTPATVTILPLRCLYARAFDNNPGLQPVSVEVSAADLTNQKGRGAICPAASATPESNFLTSSGVAVWTAADSTAAFTWLRADVRKAIDTAVTEKALTQPLVRSIKLELSNEINLELAKLREEVAALRQQVGSLKPSAPVPRPAVPNPAK